jgi:hypothetical protein
MSSRWYGDWSSDVCSSDLFNRRSNSCTRKLVVEGNKMDEIKKSFTEIIQIDGKDLRVLIIEKEHALHEVRIGTTDKGSFTGSMFLYKINEVKDFLKLIDSLKEFLVTRYTDMKEK